MEKAGVLIERLLEQYVNHATKEQLRVTTQLLLAELDNKDVQNEAGTHSVISVIFPSLANATANDINAQEPEKPVVREDKKAGIANAVVEPEVKTASTANTEKQSYNFFDPMVEIPTLALKQQEVNESIAQQQSLNDKLKSTSTHKEVGSNIKDGPIKDLKKAIGINDQYLFINELFRSDQTMYERSIKTINSFNIYGEAELWIKRELKLKLGWNENSDVVQLFDQLVRRRFP
ncbi:MAG TPA: hypothetical protein VFW07_04580 [Parafilimonas sp.]|nr:hypothetical protein [Parafilimonas sp.]